MKIYNYIRVSILTGEVLEEHSFEYDGPVSLCKGGSSGSGVDKAYNAKMAEIAEKELAMAQAYFDFWESDYKPMEQAQIKSNLQMIPYMTEAQIAEAQYKSAQYKGMLEEDEEGNSLLGLSQEAAKAKYKQSTELIGDQTAVAKAAYKAALSGVDEGAAAARAKADVGLSYGQSEEDFRRELTRTGLGLGGDQYTAAMKDLARSRAKDTAGAMTSARQKAKDEEFRRLYNLTTANIGSV